MDDAIIAAAEELINELSQLKLSSHDLQCEFYTALSAVYREHGQHDKANSLLRMVEDFNNE